RVRQRASRQDGPAVGRPRSHRLSRLHRLASQNATLARHRRHDVVHPEFLRGGQAVDERVWCEPDRDFDHPELAGVWLDQIRLRPKCGSYPCARCDAQHPGSGHAGDPVDGVGQV
ncbi:hypothetical protein FRC09_007006, partial [Ceratobasidium sp. 395]